MKIKELSCLPVSSFPHKDPKFPFLSSNALQDSSDFRKTPKSSLLLLFNGLSPPFQKVLLNPRTSNKIFSHKMLFPQNFFFKCRFHQILPSVVFPQSFQCRFHQILLYSSTSFILLFFSPREISPSLLYSQKAFAQFFSSGPSFLLY